MSKSSILSGTTKSFFGFFSRISISPLMRMLISDEPVISFSYSSVPSMSVKTFAARSRSVAVASGFLAVLTASSISSKLLPDALGASGVSSSGSSSPNSSSEGVRLVKVSSSLSSGIWATKNPPERVCERSFYKKDKSFRFKLIK